MDKTNIKSHENDSKSDPKVIEPNKKIPKSRKNISPTKTKKLKQNPKPRKF